MKRRWHLYTLLGVAVYLVMLIATFPAAYAYRLLGTHLLPASPLRPYQISGSIWSGRVGTLAYGATALGALSWQVHPLQLLLGRLALHYQLALPDGSIEGTALIGRSDLTLRKLSGRLPATALMAFNTGLPMGVDGTIAFNIAHARLPAHGTPSADGTVVWDSAALLTGQRLPLGDLKLTLKPTAHGGVDGTVADAGGGPLQLSGNIGLDANHGYHLDLRLRARPNADTALRNSLQLLGRPDPRGDYTLRYNGRY